MFAVIVNIVVAPVLCCGHMGSVEWRVGWRKGMDGGGAVCPKVVSVDDATCRRMRGSVTG